MQVVSGLTISCAALVFFSLATSTFGEIDLRLMWVFDSATLAMRCGQSVASFVLGSRELTESGGPSQSTRKYYLQYLMEMAILLVFTLHYGHLLCLHGLSMTLVDLLLLLKIRAAIVRMYRKFSVHRAYLR